VRPCRRCGGTVKDEVCTNCGEGIVSVADDSLDLLVQAASVPDLAVLFKRAKDAGVIGAVSNYGDFKSA
jgi:hypothetical protein